MQQVAEVRSSLVCCAYVYDRPLARVCVSLLHGALLLPPMTSKEANKTTTHIKFREAFRFRANISTTFLPLFTYSCVVR